MIATAELLAAEVGVGADRTLIAADIISEEAYLVALAAAEGLTFEPLDDTPPEMIPLSGERLLDGPAYGILPVTIDGNLRYVIAPNNLAARGLVTRLRAGDNLARSFRITTAERLQKLVARLAAREIADRATNALRRARGDLSAANHQPGKITGLILLAIFATVLTTAPIGMLNILGIGLGFAFIAWSGLRIASPLLAHAPAHPRREYGADELPVYTIIVALYREATAVKDLIAALRRLDYPKEKLDIKLVLEPEDRETRARLETMRLPATFEIIIAPPSVPRTKPKALNAALPFARGAFIAVYDAEDRPEPDQLRRALDAFAAEDDRLACAQARLTVDNTADSWLTRLFTAEYAGLFDVFLPSLAAMRLPLPLGGSSNHFRADVLRRIGAWDPYNVTEDADLGMRLARYGYRTTVITSSTYEEAPARLRPWLKQRTRWMKGWLQTYLVHMHSPRKLFRELGPAGFTVFQLLVGGNVLAALVHPIFLFACLWELFTAGHHTASFFASPYVLVLLIGYLASAQLGIIGLKRRRLLDHSWALLLTPLYWLLLSFAAWRALDQLVRDPHRWEKTEHGLARSSRLTARVLPATIRGIAATQSPPLRGGA